LGEGTVAFVAARCGPNPIRLIVFIQKAKRLQNFKNPGKLDTRIPSL